MTSAPKTSTIRVLCVEDHAFVVSGLRTSLEAEPDLEFVGAIETADNLVAEARRLKADVVLLDIDMPGADVFEAIYELRHQYPDARAVLLSAHVKDKYLDAAFAAGAWGYLTKNDEPDDVLDGIRKVAQGDTVFSPHVMDRSVSPGKAGSKLALLTTRERQILRMIANGMKRKEIAKKLCRSPMTIDNHRKSILKKLGVHDRVELVRYAIKEGLGEL